MPATAISECERKLFEGGIDEAFRASFVENPEADGIVGVKLADLSGRGMVVTDEDGNEWPLRGSRPLGYLRVQNAKAECEAKHPTDIGSADGFSARVEPVIITTQGGTQHNHHTGWNPS